MCVAANQPAEQEASGSRVPFGDADGSVLPLADGGDREELKGSVGRTEVLGRFDNGAATQSDKPAYALERVYRQYNFQEDKQGL